MAAAVPPPTSLEDSLIRSELSLRSAAVSNDALFTEALGVRKEAERAEAKFAKEREDFDTFVSYAKREISTKDRELRELRGALDELRRQYKEDMDELRAFGVSERQALETGAAAREEELKLRLQEASFKVERSQSFMDDKERIERHLAELEEKLALDAQRYTAAAMDAERKFIAEKGELEQRLARQREAIEHRSRQEARAELTANQQRIFRENEVLGAEVVAIAVETRKLSHTLGEVGASRASLAMEVRTLQEGEALWADRCARLTRRVKAAEARAEEAEARVAGEAGKVAAEGAALKERFAKESEGMRVENAGLKALAAAKTRELRRVKRLASIVLAQRTDVEQFFLDALAEVKMEVLERKRGEREAVAAATAAAAIAAGGPGAGAGAAAGKGGGAGLASPRAAAAAATQGGPLKLTLTPRNSSTLGLTGRAGAASASSSSSSALKASSALSASASASLAGPSRLTTYSVVKDAPGADAFPPPPFSPHSSASLPRFSSTVGGGGAIANSHVPPPLTEGVLLSPPPKGVDIYNLRADDRALVLRKLFSRMNGGLDKSGKSGSNGGGGGGGVGGATATTTLWPPEEDDETEGVIISALSPQPPSQQEPDTNELMERLSRPIGLGIGFSP